MTNDSRPEWKRPSDWPSIRTVDSHTAGEPFRLIISGVPTPEGITILQRRRWAQQHLDLFRRVLMWEPRGHADMYGGLLVPPERADSDFGILFLHNQGFSTMCGHGIIAVTVLVLETGIVSAEPGSTTLKIDTPAGQIAATASYDGRRVEHVRFTNVPSFVQHLDKRVHVPGLGQIEYDLAFGGAFYAFVDADPLGIDLVPENGARLIEVGKKITQAVAEHTPPQYDGEPDLSFLYGTIFVSPAHASSNHSRNVCIFADGELDRCPTGTGVSARLAIHHARGEIQEAEWISVESILGTTFRGRVLGTPETGLRSAVVPEIEGAAYIIGRSEFTIDPRDPLGGGFFIR